MKAQDRVLQSLGTGRILGEVREGIGWITFNHPERRNAMSLDMWQGLGAVAEAFERDPGVRVVVMKGAGGKAFVSGADISEFEQHRADAAQKKSYDEVAARGEHLRGRDSRARVRSAATGRRELCGCREFESQLAHARAP